MEGGGRGVRVEETTYDRTRGSFLIIIYDNDNGWDNDIKVMKTREGVYFSRRRDNL